MTNTQPTEEIIRNVLNNLIWSVIKYDEAPCSSSTHFNTAIYDLLTLVSDYQPPAGEEGKRLIDDALTEITLLRDVIRRPDLLP